MAYRKRLKGKSSSPRIKSAEINKPSIRPATGSLKKMPYEPVRKSTHFRSSRSSYSSKRYGRKSKEDIVKAVVIYIAAFVLIAFAAFLLYTAVLSKSLRFSANPEYIAAMNVSYNDFSELKLLSEKYGIKFSKALSLFCAENQFFPEQSAVHDTAWLEQNFIFNFNDLYNSYMRKDLEPIERMYETLFTEIEYFPIPTGYLKEQGDDYMYGNTWGAEREYGGSRTHKGCDIVDRENIRGRIPIVSMTDGIVETVGWNELGGFRVGINSTSNTYYYYAHLSEFSPGLSDGQSIKAGDIIGYMGDTGYSKKEGTTGNFTVHLHLGIRYDAEFTDDEFWLNPYVFLRNVEGNKAYVLEQYS